MNRHFDPTLYFIADAESCAPRGVIEIVEAARLGGVSMVQLRHKSATDGVLAAQVAALRAPLRAHGVKLILNDHLELAHQLEVDGLHVGQGDVSPRSVRERLGPSVIVGLSVTRAAEVATVDPELVDYVGLGPVFDTPSKADAAPPLGLEAFRSIRAALPVPVVAIGGVSTTNAAALRDAGADGLAVMSAISKAEDPTAVARRLSSIMRGSRP